MILALVPLTLLMMLGQAPGQPGPGGDRDGAPLGADDLPAYHAALGRSPGADAPLVSFAALWHEPERHRGQAVTVEGRVVRRFQQAATGVFPALSEVWLLTTDQNLICAVHPADVAADPPPTGPVRFTGVALRRLRYTSGDGPRLAPLLVGPAPPTATDPGHPGPEGPPAWTYWLPTLLALAALAIGLLGVQLRSSRPRPGRWPVEPTPLTPGEPSWP